jgi:hypothetical protein
MKTAYRPLSPGLQLWLIFVDTRTESLNPVLFVPKICCQYGPSEGVGKGTGEKRQHISHASINLIEFLRYNLSVMLVWRIGHLLPHKVERWMATIVQLQSAPVVKPHINFCSGMLRGGSLQYLKQKLMLLLQAYEPLLAYI